MKKIKILLALISLTSASFTSLQSAQPDLITELKEVGNVLENETAVDRLVKRRYPQYFTSGDSEGNMRKGYIHLAYDTTLKTIPDSTFSSIDEIQKQQDEFNALLVVIREEKIFHQKCGIKINRIFDARKKEF